MPSWNIHTAHVERLLRDCRADELGIDDVNAFLFGNYTPDIYLGFMVPNTTFHLDYCLTHQATPHSIPAPDANRFWDECIAHPLRKPSTHSGMSLALGAWAHLVADRTYNLRFREFCQLHDLAADDELRRRKQSDFDMFGKSLDATMHVRVTPGLLETAKAFRPYSILADDVRRAVEVADAILDKRSATPEVDYMLLSDGWMNDTFEICNERLFTWLKAWQRESDSSGIAAAADIEASLGKR